MEKLICHVYEDYIFGKLPEERYTTLAQIYENEKEELRKTSETLELKLAEAGAEDNASGKFLSLMEKYEPFEELSNPMLLELIDRIVVHEREIKGSINCPQKIDIFFSYIGKFVPPGFEKVISEEEKALAEKKREKQHRAYLRRKESGWQAKYDAKIRKRKRAELIRLSKEQKDEAIRKNTIRSSMEDRSVP